MQSIQVNSVQLYKYTTMFSLKHYNIMMLYTVGTIQNCIQWHEGNGGSTWEKKNPNNLSDQREFGYGRMGWRDVILLIRMFGLVNAFIKQPYAHPLTLVCIGFRAGVFFFSIRPVFSDRHVWVRFIWSWLTVNRLLIPRKTDETTMASPENLGNQI